VTLIRYLRTAGATIEQTGWPQFCRERAIPLVEALQRKERENASVAQPASDASLTCYGRAFSRSAFAWGMLCVVLLPLFLWRLVSRKMWWTLAIVIGISGLVNIRLIWDAWVSPFAESWLVVVALLVVAAAASPPDDKHPERAATFSMTPVAASLAAFIIGFPLLLNAMVLGWVRILVPKEIAWLIGMTPCLLIIVVMLRTGRQEQRNVANMEDEAVRRWDEYSATGILPDAGVSGSMGE
jgi:hypothetical protein